MRFNERWTLEVYYDILRGIHRLGKRGRKVTVSAVGHEALVPNNRLKNRFSELRLLGLLDDNMLITPAGYDFCNEYTTHPVNRMAVWYSHL